MPTCLEECGHVASTHGNVFESTHGDVMNAHTGGRREEGAGVLIVNFLLSKIGPRRSITCFRGSTQKIWILLIYGLRQGREQHDPESSKHSPHHFDSQSSRGYHYESHGFSFRSPALVLNFSKTLTVRALHGNHIVAIPFETIVKKKNGDVEDYVL